MSRPEDILRCSNDDCAEYIQNHRWAKINAQDAGWFFQRNGEIWCPIHIPGWVSEWRKKKGRG